MLILIILTLLITFLYNGYIFIKYKKIPESLSETSYLLGGNKRYWFTGYCFIICILLLPVLFEITNSNLMILPFIFCGGLAFAGCSPLFREGLDRIVHYSSAYVAFGAYILYMIFCMNWWWVLSYFVILGLLCIVKWKSYVYWAEILALLEICTYIIIETTII